MASNAGLSMPWLSGDAAGQSAMSAARPSVATNVNADRPPAIIMRLEVMDWALSRCNAGPARYIFPHPQSLRRTAAFSVDSPGGAFRDRGWVGRLTGARRPKRLGFGPGISPE